MQLVLVMFRAEGERRSFSIPRDVTIVGRREDCDLRIPVGEVSRKHCRFIKEGDTVRVEDMGSSNGTYHNGQRIAGSAIVQPGDSIEVGPVIFVVQIDGVPADDELTPVASAANSHNAEPSVDGSLSGLETEPHEAEPHHDESPSAQPHPGDSAIASGSGIPLATGDVHGDEPTLDLSLEDHHQAAEDHHLISEDELLLDLNTREESGKDH
jgi:predicted component of type VI protein secretion system